MIFQDLQVAMQKVIDREPVDLSHYWTFIADLEKSVPPIWKFKRKGYTKKAARLFLASWLCSREITSFKDLCAKEIYVLDQWFYGILGETSDTELNQIFNLSAYANFCIEHQAEIQILAEQIRKEKLK